MDILIKGMEMPKGCFDCPFMFVRYGDPTCRFVGSLWEIFGAEKRLDCPLIPVPKPIDYKTEADVLLKLWMDEIITDGEYNKIMERLNKAVVLERTT